MEIKTLLWIIIVILWIGIGYVGALIIDNKKSPLKAGPRLTAVVLGPLGAIIYIFNGR